ncbi:unnamed protein product [Schistocephalus solidus]|uniref:Uncharacterized protein n=1 Tax=Schistocephalus solidus TaxID=70667 RepID=A0A183TSR4_SCHSO|nr:unnamed protein product [Schistocephalus solidus]
MQQNPTTSTSATPASDPTRTTTPTNENHFIDTPPPTITDTIFPPTPLTPITAKNKTCPTPTASAAPSDYPHLLPSTPPPPPPAVPAIGTRY